MKALLNALFIAACVLVWLAIVASVNIWADARDKSKHREEFECEAVARGLGEFYADGGEWKFRWKESDHAAR